MSELNGWPESKTFEQAKMLKEMVDGNDDARNRWVYRAVRILCATFLAGELMALVLWN